MDRKFAAVFLWNHQDRLGKLPLTGSCLSSQNQRSQFRAKHSENLPDRYHNPMTFLEPTDCLIAFGSNIGDRKACFEQVLNILEQHDCIHEVAASSLYETQPVGGPIDQQPYLNAAIRFSTTLTAGKTYEFLDRIEKKLGRQRNARWEPRTIDLDLLLFGKTIACTDVLTIPHPRMTFRQFVMRPAVEIAAEMVHPLSGCKLSKILERLNSNQRLVLLVTTNKNFFTAISENFFHPFLDVKFQSPGADHQSPEESANHWRVQLVSSLPEFAEIQDRANLVVVMADPEHHRAESDSNSDNLESLSRELFDHACAFPGPSQHFSVLPPEEFSRQLAVTLSAMVDI